MGHVITDGGVGFDGMYYIIGMPRKKSGRETVLRCSYGTNGGGFF